MSEIKVRPANLTTEERDADGTVTKTVKTFNLGRWEMWKIQQGIEKFGPNISRTEDEDEANEHMAFFAWLIGSCPDVQITITATYES